MHKYDNFTHEINSVQMMNSHLLYLPILLCLIFPSPVKIRKLPSGAGFTASAVRALSFSHVVLDAPWLISQISKAESTIFHIDQVPTFA